MVEERHCGGVCLNVGCIPSKALLRNAELAHIVTKEADFFGLGIEGTPKPNFTKAWERSRKVVDGRVKGVHYLMTQIHAVSPHQPRSQTYTGPQLTPEPRP